MVHRGFWKALSLDIGSIPFFCHRYRGSTTTRDIHKREFKGLEIEGSDCIERHIVKDQRPLKERIRSVSFFHMC